MSMIKVIVDRQNFQQNYPERLVNGIIASEKICLEAKVAFGDLISRDLVSKINLFGSQNTSTWEIQWFVFIFKS